MAYMERCMFDDELRHMRLEARPVREMREWIEREVHRDVERAPFPAEDGALAESVGATRCSECPMLAGNARHLYSKNEVKKDSTCLDATCYQRKAERWAAGLIPCEHDQADLTQLEEGEGESRAAVLTSVPEADETCDALYHLAARAVIEAGEATVSVLRNKLQVPRARAITIMDDLERMGVVAPADGDKPRAVLVKPAPAPVASAPVEEDRQQAFPLDTMIATADGAKRADELQPGDEVKASAGVSTVSAVLSAAERERQAKQRARRDAEIIARRECLTAVISRTLHAHKPVPTEDLRLMAESFVAHLSDPARTGLVKLLGWQYSPLPMAEQMARLTRGKLLQLMLCCAVADELLVPNTPEFPEPERLGALAKRWGVKLSEFRAGQEMVTMPNRKDGSPRQSTPAEIHDARRQTRTGTGTEEGTKGKEQEESHGHGQGQAQINGASPGVLQRTR